MIVSHSPVFSGRLPVEMPASPPWLSAWTGLIPFAYWIVWALRPRHIVELGVHSGLSYCAFCEEVQRNGLDTRCTGVDTWQGDSQAGFYDADVLRALRAYHDPLYSSFSELKQMRFEEAAQTFADGTIDLLHIDGFHSYEAVRQDFETWRAKLSPNAVVLFHDIAVEQEGFGVGRFWNEVRQGRLHFALDHSQGLGVLGTGAQYPEPLMALFNAPEEIAAGIRAAFKGMGAHVSVLHQQKQDIQNAILPTGISLQALNTVRRLRSRFRGAL